MKSVQCWMVYTLLYIRKHKVREFHESFDVSLVFFLLEFSVVDTIVTIV